MIGMPLADLAGLSLDGFCEIVAAWNRAHDPDGAGQITETEASDLAAWLDGLEISGNA